MERYWRDGGEDWDWGERKRVVGGLGQTNIKFRDATSRGQRDQDE